MVGKACFRSGLDMSEHSHLYLGIIGHCYQEGRQGHLEVVQPLCIDCQHIVFLLQGKQIHITNALLLFLLNVLGLRLDPGRKPIDLDI